ncbi:sialate O-acetylesterase [Planctomicrobium sp.]|nr:sialate O-acetylesterase [Planctomicrobium sp.]MDB4733261.1 sialate O-acetylesterase [Planctomicrobium sp.]
MSTVIHGEELTISFGASSDLAARYGKHDVTSNAKQTDKIGAPQITINGLDLDGIGQHDDIIEVTLSLSATGGKLARLAQGYRLDSGYSLEFRIESAAMKFGNGQFTSIKGKFLSVSGNNRGATFESENQGNRLIVKSTSEVNNRARRVEFVLEVPVDVTKFSAPKIAQKKAPNTAERKSNSRSASILRIPEKPRKAVAPPITKTESLLLPRLFCDDMILQQKTKNTFWGWAKPNEKIIVTSSWGAKGSTLVDKTGRWKLFLQTPEAGTGHSLAIQGSKDTISINNVAVGEVWLCAGQSNMGWSMGNSFEAEQEADVDLPNLRIFKSAREHWHEPLEMQRDRLSHWKPCNPDSASETSAVSYYFGKKLHQELGIPVGIIQQAYAGTPIEGWMPLEIQQSDKKSVAYKTALDEVASKRGSRDQALTNFFRELEDYNSLIDAGQTMKNSVKPLSPPMITKPADLGHQYPGHQFNAMIYPIRPYGIRGMIWYQGERNSKNAAQAIHYRGQLAQLIRYYRSSWHELSHGGVPADFPFQFTQLPSWTSEQTTPVEGVEAPWAINREMMRLVTIDVPNTAMAVSIDTGDVVALHPKNKKPIGIRHAYLALKQTYGKDIIDSGPRYRRQMINGDTIILQFDSIGSGMIPARNGKLDAFAISGKDQSWHWADVKIQGNTVVVSSEEVTDPVAVRYAWGMNPSQRNLLYNREGLPASPFRTDDWPLYDPDATVVTVTKPAKTEDRTSVDWERPKMTQ